MNLSHESCELWELLPQQSPDCSRDGQHNLHAQQSSFQPLMLTFGFCSAVEAHVSFAMQMLTFPAVIAFCCYCCAVYDFVLCTEGKMWKLSSILKRLRWEMLLPSSPWGVRTTQVFQDLWASVLPGIPKKSQLRVFCVSGYLWGPELERFQRFHDSLEGTRVSAEQCCAKCGASFWAELIEEWTFSADFQLCCKFRCSRQLKLKVFTPIKLVKMRKKLKDILWIWKSKF